MAKVIHGGNLLLKCKTEEQRNATLHIEIICKKTLIDKRVLCGKRLAQGSFPLEDLEIF